MAYKAPTTHTPTSGGTAPYTWGSEVVGNFNYLRDAFSIQLFPDTTGLVDPGIAGMGFAYTNGTAGTPVVDVPILQANGTAITGRKWVKECPLMYAGSMSIAGIYYMPVAGSAAFVLGVRVAALATGGTLSSKAFDTQTLGTITASTTANAWTAFSVTIPSANSDALVAGNPVNIEVERVPTDAGDTEGGTVNFVTIGARFSLHAYA